MVRNSGKFGKPKRGGAKRFTPARTLQAEANEKEGMWEGEKSSGDEDEDEDEDGEEGEESSSEDEEPSAAASLPRASTSTSAQAVAAPAVGPDGKDRFGNVPDLSARDAKKAAKQLRAQKAQAESDSDDDDDVLNAGKGNANLAKQMKASSLGGSSEAKPSKAPPAGMNRKEREEAAKKAAREKYLELHRQGKTTEAKADLARLALIRKEREEAAARKAAEKAEQDAAKDRALKASGRKR